MKKYLLGTVAALALAGCSVNVAPIDNADLQKAATEEMAAMFPAAQAVVGEIDIDEVVQRALSNNLDTRLRKMETVFSRSRLNVDNLSMLPVIAANAGYTSRDEQSYSTSKVLGSAAPTGSYSTSGDAAQTTGDLTATWNVLDMAVGYYNANQSADRALISVERERRAAMDLIQSSKEAYWRAYAAERLSGRVAANIAKANRTLNKIQQGAANGAIAQLDALRQRKAVLEAVRQLELLKQGLDVATIELSQMINARPGDKIDLESEKMSIPRIGMSLAELEQKAFVNSPDIREQTYRSRIAISDVKKASVDLFPSLSATASLQYSSNDYLLKDDWSQYGLNVGWNLMRLATAPQRMDNARTGVEVEYARALAVRMAVLAKTHIAYREYQYAVQQFNRESDLYRIETALAKENRARNEASVGTEIDTLVSETSAMMAEMRRYRAYAQMVSAAERVKSTVGDDSELARALGERNTRIATAQNDKATAEATIEAETDRMAALDKDLVSLAKTRAKLEGDIAKQQAVVDAKTAAVNALVAEQQAASQDLAQLTASDADAAALDMGQARANAADAKAQQRAATANLRKMERALAATQRTQAKEMAALEKARAKAEGLEGDDLTAQAAVIATQEQAVRDLAATAAAQQEAIAAQTAQIAQLSGQVDAAEGDIAFVKALAPKAKTVSNMTAQVEKAQADLAAETADLTALQAALAETVAAQEAATQARAQSAQSLQDAQGNLATAESLLTFYAPFN